MSAFDSEAEEDPNIGLLLDGRYQIESAIGAGATGVVYRAMQTKVDRKVAVKLLKKKYSANEMLRKRFETEARAVAKLSDPHCITLFDFGYDEGADRLYMVFDYVEGQSLEDLLPGPVPVETALSFVVQIASALAHAHEAGIFHRDLKPSNVLIERTTRGERARVVDFGLARIHEDEGARLTVHGAAMGTPAYMSPEQCLGQLTVGPPTDIYALGCIAYELLQGEIPYPNMRSSQMMQAHISDPVPKITTDGVPAVVVTLVELMMSKSAANRPPAATVIDLIAPLIELDLSMEMQLGVAARSGEYRLSAEAIKAISSDSFPALPDEPVDTPPPSITPRLALPLIAAFMVVALLLALYL